MADYAQFSTGLNKIRNEAKGEDVLDGFVNAARYVNYRMTSDSDFFNVEEAAKAAAEKTEKVSAIIRSEEDYAQNRLAGMVDRCDTLLKTLNVIKNT